jgi:arginyl-tRNA synthetase
VPPAACAVPPSTASPLVEPDTARRLTGQVLADRAELVTELSADLDQDAARYAVLRSAPGRAVRARLAVWGRRLPGNPWFDVQHAHAQLSRTVAAAAQLGIAARRAEPDQPLGSPAEERLDTAVRAHPAAMRAALQARAPHKVAHQLEAIAAACRDFTPACPVLPRGDGPTPVAAARRLALAIDARDALAGGLALLGLPAGEHW